MIAKAEIREILAGTTPDGGFDLADGEPIVLDSFSLLWLAQALEERYGIRLDLDDPTLRTSLTSIDGVHSYVVARLEENARKPVDVR